MIVVECCSSNEISFENFLKQVSGADAVCTYTYMNVYIHIYAAAFWSMLE